jgi:hypothetical protein
MKSKTLKNRAKSKLAAKPRRWWEAPGYGMFVSNRSEPDRVDSYNIEVQWLRLVVPVTITTIAVVLDETPDANEVADRIAANPDLLDTLISPHVIDLRDCPFVPSTGVTGDMIDIFYRKFSHLAEILGVPMASDEDGLLLPDGTVRNVYTVYGEKGPVMMVMGAQREKEGERHAKAK